MAGGIWAVAAEDAAGAPLPTPSRETADAGTAVPTTPMCSHGGTPSWQRGHLYASDPLARMLRFELAHPRLHQRLQELSWQLPLVGQFDEALAELVTGGLDYSLLGG